MGSCLSNPATSAQARAAQATASLMSLLKSRDYVHGADDTDLLAQEVVKNLASSLEKVRDYYAKKVGC